MIVNDYNQSNFEFSRLKYFEKAYILGESEAWSESDALVELLFSSVCSIKVSLKLKNSKNSIYRNISSLWNATSRRKNNASFYLFLW